MLVFGVQSGGFVLALQLTMISSKVYRMNNRDDFSAKTKNALAIRACYACSICGVPTAGPSDEGSDKFAIIGIAAHIAAAAPGPGARRYDPAMSREQRRSVENGIWLCANCALLIDRDEVTFPTERLLKLKKEHEDNRRFLIMDQSHDGTGDIIAIGPKVIGVGHMESVSAGCIVVSLKHFVQGTVADLMNYCSDFDSVHVRDRYVLLNEMGFGLASIASPVASRVEHGWEISLPVAPPAKRLDYRDLGPGMDANNGKVISGIDLFEQNLERVLGMAVGDWIFAPQSGTRISEYYHLYAGSAWLDRFVKLEVIRAASVPNHSKLHPTEIPPLASVLTVNAVTVPNQPAQRRIPINFNLQVKGLGTWIRDIPIFIHTQDELSETRRREMPPLLKGVVE